jgi:hypothetical protein
VPPGGFAQAVTTTTTTIVAAPITVADRIEPTSLTYNTVNNNTYTTVLSPAVAALPNFDICTNWPGNQPSVPPGLLLTFARNGGLVCVTPLTARLLNPRAVPVAVPAGRQVVFSKRGGLLCVGRGPVAGRRLVPSTMPAGKVFALATHGKLVCLRP